MSNLSNSTLISASLSGIVVFRAALADWTPNIDPVKIPCLYIFEKFFACISEGKITSVSNVREEEAKVPVITESDTAVP